MNYAISENVASNQGFLEKLNNGIMGMGYSIPGSILEFLGGI
jgi:hypothetical protein